MHPSAPDAAHPFVETTIARLVRSRLEMTHEERAISVISGPWGIGKTWAIDAFAARHEHEVAVIKVEPGGKSGASRIAVLQHVLGVMRPKLGFSGQSISANSFWILRRAVYNILDEYRTAAFLVEDSAPFTLIFDEAQNLSRDAIEMLRFWNDGDRTAMPYPVGLIFVGNNEFALQAGASGESVISGAVRSRLLWEDDLSYGNVSDLDLTLFAQSRGIIDPGAIAEFLRFFSQRGRSRDLRQAEMRATHLKRLAGENPVTAELARSILNPA